MKTRTRRLRGALSSAFALLLVLFLLSTTQTPSAEAEAIAEDLRPVGGSSAGGQEIFSFVSQSTFVEANGNFEATFGISKPESLPPTAEIDITLFSLLEDASELDNEPQGLLHRLPAQQVERLTNQSGEVVIAFETRSSSASGDAQVLLPDPGVYPLVVDFRVQDEILQSIRTNLIRLAEAPTGEEPKPGGSATADAPSQLSLILDVGQSGLPLEKANRLLTRAEDTPLTVIIDQVTLSELEQGGVAANAFIRKSEEISLVVSPGAAADISSLAAVGYGDLYQQRLARLQQRARELGLDPKSAITTTVAPITEAGAGALQSYGFATALSSTGAFTGSPSYGTIETPSGELELISSQVTPPDGTASSTSWANQFLASLFMNQRANAKPVPSLLVLDGNVPPDFEAEELSMLLDGDGSIFRLETIAKLSAAAATVRPANSPAIDLVSESALIRTVTSHIDSYESSYIDGVMSPANYRDTLVEAMGGELTPQARKLGIQRLDVEIQDEVQSLHLPAGQAVTIAARSVPVPLTIENSSEGSRKFLLRSESDKVQIAQNEQVIIVPPGNSSIDLDVEVRSLGVSPVQVSIFTPDGENRLASTRFEVRSTAIPGLGLLLCLAGAALLAFWWFVHARRRRNKKTVDHARSSPADRSATPPSKPKTPESDVDSHTQTSPTATTGEISSGSLT